ncbi:MAG TPA: methyl-accepting chemotaxis protein [Alphaproteobacteria bacterium]|nr:methyl-accepting chemotaxis protein [Alphaproteobacteria bacterium]
MSAVRLGVRGRLWGAFAVIAALLVVSAGVSWIAFGQFDNALGIVVDQKLPRIESALNLVHQGDRVATAGVGLAGATTVETRAEQAKSLEEEMARAEALLQQLRESGMEAEQSDSVKQALDHVRANMKQIDALVGESLERQAKLAEWQQVSSQIAERFATALQPLASEQRNALVGFISVLNGGSTDANRRLAAADGIQRIADSLRALGRTSSASATLQAAFAQIPLTTDPAALDRLGQGIRREIDTMFSAIDEMDEKTGSALTELVEEWEKLAKADVVGLQRAQLETAAKRKQLVQANTAAAQELAKAIGQSVTTAKEEVSAASESARQLVDRSMITLLAIGGFGLGVAFLIGWFYVGRSVAGRLIALEGAMRRVAEGDLTAEMPPAGSDEIGAMTEALRVFKSNAQQVRQLEAEQAEAKRRAEEERKAATLKLAAEFENSVKGIVSQVGEFVQEMRKSAESLTSTAADASQRSAGVATATEEAMANTQTVASASEELATSIAEIARQVSQSASVAGKAVQAASGTTAVVTGLNQAAQKIGDVLKMIQDIAGRTNLLALNATIEAARAGESGKGFAVVASEVKSLANQTAKATEEIAQQIDEIQGATEQTVSAIESISATIGEINSIASMIASAVEEQGATTREIATNIQQVATGMRDVASNTAGAKQAATTTGEAAVKVLNASTELARQSDALRAQIDSFLEVVRAA